MAAALNIANRYSPKNPKRAKRPDTRFIILHTTEGGERGALSKIRRRGEAHYFVNPKGKIYRVIDKRKIATHAGRSMWDGLRVIDNYSIGIEVVGYHNKDLSDTQYKALKELIRQLKSLYDIPDENVLTHSMVAYGRPNRFHSYYHRGRKRCGMIFARYDVRERLGLEDKPLADPDVAARRLRVADRELHAYLYAKPPEAVEEEAEPKAVDESNVIAAGYTAWTIARENYNKPETVYMFPDGTRIRGNQVNDWSHIPVGTRVFHEPVRGPKGFEGFLEIGRDGKSSQGLAGDEFDQATTIYFLPNGMVRTGMELSAASDLKRLLNNLPTGTRVLVGYVYGGHIKEDRRPRTIAGVKWNYPSTFYRYPNGTIVSGDDVDEEAIPDESLVFYQG